MPYDVPHFYMRCATDVPPCISVCISDVRQSCIHDMLIVHIWEVIWCAMYLHKMLIVHIWNAIWCAIYLHDMLIVHIRHAAWWMCHISIWDAAQMCHHAIRRAIHLSIHLYGRGGVRAEMHWGKMVMHICEVPYNVSYIYMRCATDVPYIRLHFWGMIWGGFG